MRMYDLIVKAREGAELSREEVRFIVREYTAGRIPDYQMAAWCMAVYFRGLPPKTTAELTLAMVDSGATLSWSELDTVIVDKHSTGGVGDKTTLVLVPWVAATGVKIAKMSGRGLGHTGGTLDKLEAIPGFRSDLSRDEFIDSVQETGLAIVGQTNDLVPADRKLYALRDVTATVDSIPLIASSIMSKKIAAGADRIILDVKVGKGAFMQDLSGARRLAETMVDIGRKTGRNTVALITNMDQPLGFSVGNVLEVREAIDTLRGKGPADLTELCLALGAEMVVQAGKADSLPAGRELMNKTLATGGPLEKLRQMITRQGGEAGVIDDPSILPTAAVVQEVVATKTGYIEDIHARTVGLIAMGLGAGRQRLEDEIDLAAGVELLVKVGDAVQKGDIIARVHGATEDKVAAAKAQVQEAISWSALPVVAPPLLLDRVSR
ncbi:MAG: pyrimidine-nucleoside phosphorylase [Firmicutes bacterium]|mgnify:FL=1|nr:pyrimidine-nucleoside phosphorylase [Bacillota bacterium]